MFGNYYVHKKILMFIRISCVHNLITVLERVLIVTHYMHVCLGCTCSSRLNGVLMEIWVVSFGFNSEIRGSHVFIAPSSR